MAKFCENCGASLVENAVKCENCGAEVRKAEANEEYTQQNASQTTNQAQSKGGSYQWNSEKHAEIKHKDKIHPVRIVLAVIFSIFTLINFSTFSACVMGYGFIKNLNSENVNKAYREFSDYIGRNTENQYSFGDDGSYYGDSDDIFRDIFGDAFTDDYGGYGHHDAQHVSYVTTSSHNYNHNSFSEDSWRNILNDIQNYGGLTAEDAVSFDRAMSVANSGIIFAIILFGVLTIVFGIAIFLSLGVRMRSWLTPGIIFTCMGAFNVMAGGFILAAGNILRAASLYNIGSLVASCGVCTLISSGTFTVIGIILIIIGVCGRKRA